MEAWKFVDYSIISPVFAQSFTTERWGLDALPGNLVAITGYRDRINSSKAEVKSAWGLPYSCSDNPSDYFNLFYRGDEYLLNDTGDYSLAFATSTFTLEPTAFCPRAQSCPTSGCFTLVKGIGKKTVGLADSSIVGLSHGISFLVSLILTIALVMRCGPSKPLFSSSSDR
jgi:hypothetical protein